MPANSAASYHQKTTHLQVDPAKPIVYACYVYGFMLCPNIALIPRSLYALGCLIRYRRPMSCLYAYGLSFFPNLCAIHGEIFILESSRIVPRTRRANLACTP